MSDYRIHGATGEWEVVIGLEVHAHVTSNAKLFSGAATAFGAEPNTQVSLIDAAMLVRAAETFHATGHGDVASIEVAHQTLAPLLGHASATVFAISLLASGLSSSTVGTMIVSPAASWASSGRLVERPLT